MCPISDFENFCMLSHQLGPSQCLLWLAHQIFSSNLCSSLLILLNSASYKEVRPLSARRNKCDLWMGQPTKVLAGKAGSSQTLWSSSPLFSLALLQGNLLRISFFFFFLFLPLIFLNHALSEQRVTAKWLTDCRNACALQGYICEESHLRRGINIVNTAPYHCLPHRATQMNVQTYSI